MPQKTLLFIAFFITCCMFNIAEAAEVISSGLGDAKHLDLTHSWAGYVALVLFSVAYILAMTEEVTDLRKSKPMVFAASIIWVGIASVYALNGMSEQAGQAFRTVLIGYAELFLFIMVSMTYLNAMEDRSVFERLRVWLLSKNFSYRQLFWITGFQAFFISSACNNLTTALLMGSVIVALGKDSPRFVTLSCINVVVASNAGGSFSPFGDITTLLVWQKGVVPFADFFSLLIPAIVNLVVPATIMHFFIPRERPAPMLESQPMKRGGWVVIVLFALTIITSACFENFLSLPPAAGMMLGLTYLKFFSYFLQKTQAHHNEEEEQEEAELDISTVKQQNESNKTKPGSYIDYFAPMKVMNKAHNRELELDQPFDVFHKVANLEWDTLLFFYGVYGYFGCCRLIGFHRIHWFCWPMDNA